MKKDNSIVCDRYHCPSSITLPKLLVCLTILISFTYIFHTLNYTHTSQLSSSQNPFINPYPRIPINLYSVHETPVIAESEKSQNQKEILDLVHETLVITESGPTVQPEKTQLKYVVFGIGGSVKLWDHRKNYMKLWWREGMRGFVWLDEAVNNDTSDDGSAPPWKISSDTSEFNYTHEGGDRSAIRITRIVSETVRLGLEDVRWVVMGDDDTMFFPDNLVRVLQKYDHNQFYYIGGSSETHVQNMVFSYNMAFGGGGFAISYALAKALEKTQDRCIERYPYLYGSDNRIHACMAELGVPLTKELGFHQCDLYGNLFGLLTAHPVTPLVSLHHLDLVDPIFPNADKIQALKRLNLPKKLDSDALMQQSICYEDTRKWTISVTWGYAVQIFRGIISPRDMEVPSRTFLNWQGKDDRASFTFKTQPVGNNGCQKPYIYLLSNALYDFSNNRTASEYVRHRTQHHKCWWKMHNPSQIHRVEVYKKPDPHIWEKSPRRNCCRVLPQKRKGTIAIDVGVCGEGETIEAH